MKKDWKVAQLNEHATFEEFQDAFYRDLATFREEDLEKKKEEQEKEDKKEEKKNLLELEKLKIETKKLEIEEEFQFLKSFKPIIWVLALCFAIGLMIYLLQYFKRPRHDSRQNDSTQNRRESEPRRLNRHNLTLSTQIWIFFKNELHENKKKSMIYFIDVLEI